MPRRLLIETPPSEGAVPHLARHASSSRASGGAKQKWEQMPLALASSAAARVFLFSRCAGMADMTPPLAQLVGNSKREPINAIISAKSDPAVLTDAGLRDYVRYVCPTFLSLRSSGRSSPPFAQNDWLLLRVSRPAHGRPAERQPGRRQWLGARALRVSAGGLPWRTWAMGRRMLGEPVWRQPLPRCVPSLPYRDARATG
jgi:hypothetical protein